jgi:hypothetical protein
MRMQVRESKQRLRTHGQFAGDASRAIDAIAHRRALSAKLRGDFHLFLQQNQAANAVMLDELPVFVGIAGGHDNGHGPPVATVWRESRQIVGHLRAEPALGIEEDQKHIPAPELGQLAGRPREIRQFKIRCEGAHGQTAGLTPLLRGAGRREIPSCFSIASSCNRIRPF